MPKETTDMVLKWKQVGDDYELRCPCCASSIAHIYKLSYLYNGVIHCDMSLTSPVLTGQTFRAVRALVNKRVEELLNH